jgi:heterodisulfide reductase subunit A
MFSKDQMATNPEIAFVNTATCVGCFLCKSICPYKAIEPTEVEEWHHGHKVIRTVAGVNSGLCQGCGACTAECRSGSLNLKGFTNLQLLAEVDAACL